MQWLHSKTGWGCAKSNIAQNSMGLAAQSKKKTSNQTSFTCFSKLKELHKPVALVQKLSKPKRKTQKKWILLSWTEKERKEQIPSVRQRKKKAESYDRQIVFYVTRAGSKYPVIASKKKFKIMKNRLNNIKKGWNLHCLSKPNLIQKWIGSKKVTILCYTHRRQ